MDSKPPHLEMAASPRAAALARTATATAIILGSGVVTGFITARSLGPAGRGNLTAIVVWTSTLVYAGTVGLPDAVAYYTAANAAVRDRIWVTAQAGALVLGLFVTLVGWALFPLLFAQHDAGFISLARWYLVLFAVPCLGSLTACAWLQGTEASRAFNVSRAAVHVTGAVLMAGLYLAHDRSLSHFLAALLIANVTTWILAAWFGPVGAALKLLPSKALMGPLLRYGVRVQFGSWSSAANLRLDQLLLSLFASAATLGIYVVAVSYANLLLTVAGSAAFVMLPDVVRAHQAGGVRACVAQWYRRVLWITLLVGTVLALTSGVVLPWLFGQAFASAVSIVTILLLASVVLGLNQILTTAFRGIGAPQIASTSEVIGVAITVPALILLLPHYGIFGAAVASLAAYAGTHLYLLWRVIGTLEVDGRSLVMLDGEDMTALWEGVVSVLKTCFRKMSGAVTPREI